MKNTILSVYDANLLENLLVDYGKIVTTSQVFNVSRDSEDYQQVHNRIRKLIENGWLIRIKRGLYAISDLSNRHFLNVSPYVIAGLLVQESYISFEAALAYRGMFDQLVKQYSSVSLKQYKERELGGIRYRFIKTGEKRYTGWEEVAIENMKARIAYAEKALVDMVHFRSRKYAVDMVIEKLQMYESDLVFERLEKYISEASLKTVKVFGLIFDMLGLDSDSLYHFVSGSSSTHRMSSGDKTFNARWRLYYDDYFEKYRRKRGD